MNFAFSHYRSLAGVLLLCGFGSLRADETTPVPLDRLVADIVAQNPELDFYQAEISAAQAGRRGAGAWADPELSLTGGHKRVRDASGVLAGEGTAWSVSVTQTFEWPGRLALRKSLANGQVELAELGLERFKSALSARAATLAFGLHVANAKRAAIREVADRFAALKETFVARDAAGITPLLETRVIEASELALQRRATDAELALQAALIELNQLRGAPVDAPLQVATAALKFNDPPDTDALLTAARANNFEFRLRRAELEQQGLQVQLARHERYPAVSVGPYLSQENAGEKETVVGLSLNVPLPITARSRTAVSTAESRQRQAETAVQLARRELEKEVLTTAQAFTTKLAEARRWAADTTTRFREAATLADRHYRLGAVPIATYVELQTSYLEATDAVLSTQQEALEAGLKLQQLTGLNFRAVEVGQ